MQTDQRASIVQRQKTIDLTDAPKPTNLTQLKLPPQETNIKQHTSFRKLFTDGRERFQARKRHIGRSKGKTTLFGAPLLNLPIYPSEQINSELERGVPEFVVRCLKRINEFQKYDGLYRINGDADEVIKMKYVLFYSGLEPDCIHYQTLFG